MAVAIVFSSSNGGSAVSDPLSHGNTSNGAITTPQVTFIRHNGVNPITTVGLYIDLANPYTGDFSALSDMTELLSWGDAGASGNFGGYEINQNATGSFPGASWPTFANKTTTDTHGTTIRTGVGDSAANKIGLQTVSGASIANQIQVGGTPNVRISSRIVTPTSLATLGARAFKLILSYTYTS